jgi:hypothetical protein
MMVGYNFVWPQLTHPILGGDHYLPIEKKSFEREYVIPFNMELINEYQRKFIVTRSRKIAINTQLIEEVRLYSKQFTVKELTRIFSDHEERYSLAVKGCRGVPRAQFIQMRRFLDMKTKFRRLSRSQRLYRSGKLIHPPKVHPGNRWPIIHDREGRMYPSRNGQFILTDENQWLQVEDGFDDLQKINACPPYDRIYHCSPVFVSDEDSYSDDIMAEQIALVTNKDPRHHSIRRCDKGPDPADFAGFEGYKDIPSDRIIRVVNKIPDDQNQRYLALTPNVSRISSSSNSLEEDEYDIENDFL